MSMGDVYANVVDELHKAREIYGPASYDELDDVVLAVTELGRELHDVKIYSSNSAREKRELIRAALWRVRKTLGPLHDNALVEIKHPEAVE